jgi:hypothetical protein
MSTSPWPASVIPVPEFVDAVLTLMPGYWLV